MTETSFVPLPGSQRSPITAAEQAGRLDDSERIDVTLVTRRMAELPRTAGDAPARLSRQDLRQRHGSDPASARLGEINLVQNGRATGTQA